MSNDEAINRTNEGRKFLVRPTIFWKFMVWWIKTFRGSKDNVQCGTLYYGGVILLAIYLESPGLRKVIAQTAMTLDQAKHYHAELTRQIERMEAFS